MRVLLVNTSEDTGGAAIAAGRLLQALCRNGVEAELLVRDATCAPPQTTCRVRRLPCRLLQRARFVLERGCIFLQNGFSRKKLFAIDTATLGADITHLPEFRRADVVHLHWVNQGMLSLRDIRRILRTGKPVVWTMHDMWPFTGVCHHAASCNAWLDGCGRCPLLRRPSAGDLSRRTFLRKARTYSAGRCTFVGCSHWLTELARRAPLLQGQTVVSAPNPLDTALYRPADADAARRRQHLPLDKCLILFVAHKATDPNKGIGYLREAVSRLCRHDAQCRESLAVVVVGHEAETLKDTFPTPLYIKGYVGNAAAMIDLYNAADVLAMPTLMDNLPNTVAEAMACGTPCVGFEVGGLPQMVDNGHNGLLAPVHDADSLAHNLWRALFDPSCAAFPRAARAKALSAYSEEAVAERYAGIYRDAIAAAGRP